jgi:Zinc knuckle
VPHKRPFKQEAQETDVSENSGMSFLQKEDLVPGLDGVVHHSIKCYNCNQHGHYSSECPVEAPQDAVQMLQATTPRKKNLGRVSRQQEFSFTQSTTKKFDTQYMDPS